MTKYTSKNNRQPDNDIVVVGDREYNQDVQREYICKYCQKTMSKLIDSSGLNPSWYCSSCSISMIPQEVEQLRSKSKLKTPDGPVEYPSVSYPLEYTLEKNKAELSGVFKSMQEKGLKVKDVKEYYPKSRGTRNYRHD